MYVDGWDVCVWDAGGCGEMCARIFAEKALNTEERIRDPVTLHT